MKRAAWIAILFSAMIPMATLAAEVGQAMTARVLTASPQRTVVAAEFDGAMLRERMQLPPDVGQISDGLGMLLAIAGHGQPTVRVQTYELGEALQPTAATLDAEIAASSDELVSLDEPAILHDLRVVGVGFRPLMRDGQGALRLVRRLEAEIVPLGGGGVNEKDDPSSLSSAFYPIYRTAVANLDQTYPELEQRAPGRMLIIAPTRLYQEDIDPALQYQRWLDLKKRKGYTIQIATLFTISQTVGDSAQTGIRQYIRQTYDDGSLPDLEYALIIGDDGNIASFQRRNPEHTTEYSVGDNLYFTTAGDDYLPDVIHGRVSGTSANEYVAYFNKAYRYEAEPYVSDMQWFQSACFVAGNFNEGTYPVTPVWNVRWARERLMRDGCITDADTFFYHDPNDPPPGQYRVPIRNDINAGVSMIFYRGWGNTLGWLYPVFNLQDLGELTNGRRTPAVFSLVCGAGDFAAFSGPCHGEVFTTGLGTPNEVRGAVNYIGASDLHTNTRHNNAILAGIVQALTRSEVRGAGALLLAGKLEGWRQFPLEHEPGEDALAYFYVLHVFNLLGDPEMQILTCQPASFTLTHPSSLSVGETLVDVEVTAGGSPVSGAVVTLRGSDVYQVSAERTDAIGHAYLPISFVTWDGLAQLTVWKSGFFLKQVDIPVVNTAFDPKIETVNWSAGEDNLPNPGESVSFTLTVRNHGTTAATLAIAVQSLDPRIAVTSGAATTSTIQPGEAGTSTTIALQLGGELWNGERPRLSVQLQDGSNSVTRQVEVPVAAPDPVVTSVTVIDGDDGILEADEEADILVTVRNVGAQAATYLSAVPSSFDNAIAVDGSVQWDAVPIGQSAESDSRFQAHLAAGVTAGRQIVLRFAFYHAGAVVAHKQYVLPTGVVTIHAPTGPDAYGYYAYEDIDGGYAATPSYSWVELDPAYSGNGTPHEVRDDTYFGMALPQAFTYYGQSFDSVWICSNGWLSLERATIPEFRNWELPSPMGAPSLICPFWDDLMIDRTVPNDDSLHWVWTRYDATTPARFIVQWRTLNGGGLPSGGQPSTAFCTFEAILEYRALGDGDIVFQYHEIANVDQQGTGNFATVGIEDSYHERGLSLTYASRYLPSVDTLRAGRAIRFTTTPPDAFSEAEDPNGPWSPRSFALHEPYPNPFNPRTELRFDLPKATRVLLRVYDILGRESVTLVNEYRPAGSYSVAFDASSLPSGLYFARLSADRETMVRKMVLMK